MLRGIRDSKTSTPQRDGVKEYKLRQDKRLSPAINVGACTLVVVDMVRKNAMGVVLQITRLQIASSRRGTGNTQVSGAENNPVSQGGRSPTNAISRSNRGGKRPQAGGRVFSLEGEGLSLIHI